VVEDVRLNVKPWIIAFFLVLLMLPVLSLRSSATDSVSTATVYVAPDNVTVGVNETFQISVSVSMVSKLQGFDFKLSYDAKVLECLDLEEGTFLSASGPTFVVKREIDNSFTGLGRLWFAVVIYKTGFSDGNGTLAVITFKAVSTGETVLNIYSDSPHREDTAKFTTCKSEVIPNVAVDGSVTIVPDGSSSAPIDPPPNSPDPPSLDVTGDGVVDIKDLACVAAAYGSVKGQLKYDEKADLDQNEAINILDVILVAKQIRPA
jgi:hypothetical protein